LAGSESRAARIASLLAERYELLEQFGQGGFATVYRVKNLRLGRVEALKVLSQELTEDSDFALRFQQEARVSASLDHPNIVKIYDYGVIAGIAWFSMQFINGQSLGRELNAGLLRMDLSEAVRIAAYVLDALEYSHGRGVIHRDIKPDNIMIDAWRRPYLADFGIAKAEDSLVKTRSGLLIGSPAYMAPEQLRGGVSDARTDLYALGVTLYRMLTGSLPFQGADAMSVAMKKLQEAPEALRAKRPEVDPRLESIIMRALSREPEQRFATAHAMREALEAYSDGLAKLDWPGRPSRSGAAANAGSSAKDLAPTVRAGPREAPAGSSTALSPEVAAAARTRRILFGAGLGVLAAVVLGGGWALWTRNTGPDSRSASTPVQAATATAVVSVVVAMTQPGRLAPSPPMVPASSVSGQETRPATEEPAREETPVPTRPTPRPATKPSEVGQADLGSRRLSTPARAQPPAVSTRYCASFEPTAYVQGVAKEIPSGFSSDQGAVGRAPRPDSARIQIEFSVRPTELVEDQPFEISAKLINGGDMDLTLERVEESAVRSHGGFQRVDGLSLPTTASVGGEVGVYRYKGVMRGGATYYKEIRITDLVGDSWKASVRLLPCTTR
jgi:serine/threonine-protein kinase